MVYSSGDGESEGPQGNILSSLFEKFVLAMVAYFIVSILHSLAQSYHKRKCKQESANS